VVNTERPPLLLREGLHPNIKRLIKCHRVMGLCSNRRDFYIDTVSHQEFHFLQ